MFFGKAQQTISSANVLTPVTPTTVASAGLSQFQVEGKLFTQNSKIGGAATGTNATGSFDASARWNSMGNLNSGTQTLNGVRTQTDGKGLAFGHLIPNGSTVSNPFIEWIGNLEFNYAN